MSLDNKVDNFEDLELSEHGKQIEYGKNPNTSYRRVYGVIEEEKNNES